MMFKDASDYYFRVPVAMPIDINQLSQYHDKTEDMATWCYCNFGDQWGYDKYGFWFATEHDANWFNLRWADACDWR